MGSSTRIYRRRRTRRMRDYWDLGHNTPTCHRRLTSRGRRCHHGIRALGWNWWRTIGPSSSPRWCSHLMMAPMMCCYGSTATVYIFIARIHRSTRKSGWHRCIWLMLPNSGITCSRLFGANQIGAIRANWWIANLGKPSWSPLWASSPSWAKWARWRIMQNSLHLSPTVRLSFQKPAGLDLHRGPHQPIVDQHGHPVPDDSQWRYSLRSCLWAAIGSWTGVAVIGRSCTISTHRSIGSTRKRATTFEVMIAEQKSSGGVLLQVDSNTLLHSLSILLTLMQHGYHHHSVAHPPGVCLHIGAVATLFLGISMLKEVVEGDLPSLCNVVNLSDDTWHMLLLLLVDATDNPRFTRTGTLALLRASDKLSFLYGHG